MARSSPDRRTQKTRQALMSAFVELLLSQGYEALSTTQISRRANVGRSTFYLHYPGKEALLKESLKVPSRGLAACVDEGARAEQLLPLLEHFRAQRSLCRAFFRHPVRPLWADSLASLIEARLRAASPRPGLPRGVLATLIAEMQLALLAQWLTGRVALRPETVAGALVDKTRALVAA